MFPLNYLLSSVELCVRIGHAEIVGISSNDLMARINPRPGVLVGMFLRQRLSVQPRIARQRARDDLFAS